jgi:hypothetical protein
MYCFTPSKLNQAVPLPLNSISILKIHLYTDRFFIIKTVNLSIKSSLLLKSLQPGATGNPKELKSSFATDFLEYFYVNSYGPEYILVFKYSAMRNSSFPTRIGTI